MGAAIRDEDGPEAKIVMRILPLMSSVKGLKDVLEGDEEELTIASRIINQCVDYLQAKTMSVIAACTESKVYATRATGLENDIRVFTKNYCQELMVAYGNQLLTILEKQGAKSEGELTQPEKAKLQALKDAQERKRVLEPFLYHTFIFVSQRFKAQLKSITEHVRSAKVYEQEDPAEIKKFYDFISTLNSGDKSIPRIALLFSLMMSAHKPEVTWLDEISEALMNCAEGLNFYLVMSSNLPKRTQLKLQSIDSYKKLVEESLRSICYSIGVLAYRLTLLSSDEKEEQRSLSKLNILQGGIEARFIPALT